MEDAVETLVEFATTYGLKVIGAILLLIIGRMVAGFVRKGIRKAMARTNTDKAVASFVSSLGYYLVLVVVVLAALKNFGIETASLVAVLGAVGFAVGFALQGSLSNFAAGVLLLIFRPYHIGDYVEAGGVAGTVRDMGMFSTVLTTPDNVRVIVPNGKIFGDVIKNYAGEDTRRVDMVIGIGYDSSITKATEIMFELMKADGRVLSDPAPVIAVAELADSSVNLVVRPWVKKEDYWGVKFDLTRKIKETFDESGIEIPFPQRVVHTKAAAA
jgi:small conductance mechanosensitive channel